MRRLRALWHWITDDRVLFASPGVGRVFMRCRDCNRLRPAWELLMRAGTYQRITCRCGSRYQRPANVPWWVAVWWLLVRGGLWRKLIRRRADWDPRLPMRTI